RPRGARCEEIDVVLCSVRYTTQDPLGDRVGGGDPDGILERIKVNIEMGGECSPGDAHAIAIQIHLTAKAFTEQVRHEFDHAGGCQRLASLNTLVCLQFEACQCGHNKEIPVEVAHGFLE